MAFIQTNKKLIEAYNKVFDAQGNVRACGRQACIDLIKACDEDEPDIYFGNKETGKMAVEVIQNYVLYGKG